MGLFGADTSMYDLAVRFSFAGGTSMFGTGELVTVASDAKNKRLAIFDTRTGEKIVYLAYSQLCGVHRTNEVTTVQKGKSVLGRGAIGGMVFGPAGAIVGGLSGTGKKQKKSVSTYLVISYHPTGRDNETQELLFETTPATMGLKTLEEEIQDRCSGATTSECYL